MGASLGWGDWRGTISHCCKHYYFLKYAVIEDLLTVCVSVNIESFFNKFCHTKAKMDNCDFSFESINLQSGYISVSNIANWSFRFNLIDMHKIQ